MPEVKWEVPTKKLEPKVIVSGGMDIKVSPPFKVEKK